MVLDTSAIVATVTNEPDGQRYRTAMLDADSLSMSAVAVLETRIVLSARFGTAAVAFFDELLETAGIAVVPFDAEMAKGAFEAFQRFGKGGGHPAQLNIVDCAVYALAKARSEPLLFKGADFAKTDVVQALT
ncbi:type II toxin-antitoxin system VapC family toxin [Bradyrhizobium sp. BR 10289]|uniref:type II toxin-antitoxin system VapC family toxin n=1 Tax=Bradyrhizobium sp. BR 10289 TaxID=2749993 RepID=UPI001E46DE7C|nr:type II toxin-antitoxin system VapC family toxin [Bradyrhizobium sp. BR 10289]